MRRVPADLPLLLVDVDGVLALFDLDGGEPAGRWHMIEGFPYYLAEEPPRLLHEAAAAFELVWCTGWEDRANDHLPRLAGTPGPLDVIRFARNPGRANAHWKLDEIDAYARDRPLAWIDDALSEQCHAWARARTGAVAPTLLVPVAPNRGFTRSELALLHQFAARLKSRSPAPYEK